MNITFRFLLIWHYLLSSFKFNGLETENMALGLPLSAIK